jgi:20S proteasome subunit alpha 7
MLVEGSNRRVFGIDAHAGMAVTGYAADGRQIVNRAREEAQSYRDTYGHRVVPSVLSNRLSLYMHYFTIYGSLRPFGASAILAAYDEDTKTPELYMLDPSGATYRFHGCAAGKGTNAAKTELEKIFNRHGAAGITCRQAVLELGKM